MLRILTLAAVAVLAGCAAQPPEARLNDTASSLTQKRFTSQCLQTGTRIRLGEDECAATPGRAFSQEELQQTGAFTLSEALRKLDPSLGR